ncbi:uncharacterized protein LOC131955978 isoform X2 [Physella acuta]|uniref:uncharacterized protein LOC131955978 isoform X1 n=1 Tax=Physella acuta TaxID=109671 RepID=UPI0027DC2395|nr:uncharacterized protein LOC131955978 isoform X1 [Physella acuta]XP_059176297.1 uncharacterized protein LOC131955978 isoform X2 [Physella acuta]
MTRLVHRLVVGACLAVVLSDSLLQAFTLRQSPNKIVTGLTKNVTVECSLHTGDNSEIAKVNWIRILKKSGQAWTAYAELRDVDSCVVTSEATEQTNVGVSGYVGAASESFLKISWEFATDEILGSYRCDVVGLSKNQDLVVVKTPLIALGVGEMSANQVFYHLKDAQDSLEQRLRWLEQNIGKDFTTVLNKISELFFIMKSVDTSQETLLEVVNGLQAKQVQCDSPDLKRKDQDSLNVTSFDLDMFEITEGVVEAPVRRPVLRTDLNVQEDPSNVTSAKLDGWPGGSFALLMPRSGCPGNTSEVTWFEGHYKHREPNQEKSLKSEVSDIFSIKEDSVIFFNLNFCVASDNEAEKAWPQGSYCINRNNGTCPDGFTSGYVKFHHNSTQATASHDPDVEIKEGSTYIHYCCRGDAAHDAAIHLPHDAPFYLYRYGGKCQTVHNIRVVEEELTVDTEDDNNSDSYENNSHPDGKLNDVSIRVCYYSN